MTVKICPPPLDPSTPIIVNIGICKHIKRKEWRPKNDKTLEIQLFSIILIRVSNKVDLNTPISTKEKIPNMPYLPYCPTEMFPNPVKYVNTKNSKNSIMKDHHLSLTLLWVMPQCLFILYPTIINNAHKKEQSILHGRRMGEIVVKNIGSAAYKTAKNTLIYLSLNIKKTHTQINDKYIHVKNHIGSKPPLRK